MSSYKYLSTAVVPTSLLLIGSTFIPAATYADLSSISELKPFIGLDIGNSNTALQANYGEKIFRKRATSYNLFTGLNFNQYFGIELGHQQDNKRQATRALGTGDYCPGGNPILVNLSPIVFETSLRIKNIYLGATAQYPIFDKINITALLGLSRTTINAKHTIISVNGVTKKAQEIQNSLYARTYKKSKLIPMARLGANYQLNENFSLRCGITWLGSSRIKINSDQNGQFRPNMPTAPIAPNNSIRLKNSLNYSAGIIVSLF